MATQGMVDALQRIRDAVRPGGLLIDVRPSGARVPRLEREGRVVARVGGRDLGRHRAADAAVQGLVAAGALRRIRAGSFWFRHTFTDRAALLEWIAGRDDWTIDRRRVPAGTRTLRRAVEFTHYRRV